MLPLRDGKEGVDITGAVTGEAVTGSDAAVDVTGEVAVTGETEAVSITEEAGAAGAAASAWAAWWRAARRRFFSFSAGPRWRGRRKVEDVGGEGGGEKAGVEWGAPGCPRVQVKLTVVRPSLVERLREAFPPWAQTERNSVTDATTNWEFDLEVIFHFKIILKD